MIGRYVAIRAAGAIYYRVKVVGSDKAHLTVEWWDGKRKLNRESIRRQDIQELKGFVA